MTTYLFGTFCSRVLKIRSMRVVILKLSLSSQTTTLIIHPKWNSLVKCGTQIFTVTVKFAFLFCIHLALIAWTIRKRQKRDGDQFWALRPFLWAWFLCLMIPILSHQLILTHHYNLGMTKKATIERWECWPQSLLKTCENVKNLSISGQTGNKWVYKLEKVCHIACK